MPARLGLTSLLALALVAGCGVRAQDVAITVRSEAEAPVVLWFYKDGPDVERGLMSPGTYAVMQPPRPGQEGPADLEMADELAPGEALKIGPRRGRYSGERMPTLAVFGEARTLTQMAAEPRESSTVARVFLGPGENYVIVESAFPTRAVRVSPGEFRLRAEAAQQLDDPTPRR